MSNSDIRPKAAPNSELQLTLAPLSSPHRTRAAQALCDMLDQTATVFPGSRLRLRFAVRATAHRAGLPRLAGRAQRHQRRRPAPLIGPQTGHLGAMLCQEA